MIKETLDIIKHNKESEFSNYLDCGLPRIRKYYPGVTQGSYTVLFAESSTGKSAWADNSYLLHPYEDYKRRVALGDKMTLKIPYWSMEISMHRLLTKLIARKIYMDYREKYKTDLILPISYILSAGENRISQEHWDIVCSYKDYFEEMEDVLTIYDNQENPTLINSRLREIALSHGHMEEVTHFEGKALKNTFSRYVNDNHNFWCVPIIDSAHLQKVEEGLNEKGLIDRLSDYLLRARNVYNDSPVLIMQANRALSSTDRVKINRVRPQLSDIQGSSKPAQDANTVISLFSPYRYEIETYDGYDITKLGNRMVSCGFL